MSWNDRDTMLYALGVGMCADGLDERELRFVLEPEPVALPTQATTVAWGPNLLLERAAGLTFSRIVHASQKVEMHRPMPCRGTIDVDHEVIGVMDKGAGKGAFMTTETRLTLDDGSALATLTSTVAARADGGFGGPRGGEAAAHGIPDRAPDVSVELATRPDQALLYRLSGDRNPLHADPATARAAGFDRPILHGLCTYGIACRAVVQAFCGYDPARVLSHEARFAAPVFPGEVLTFDMWRDGPVVSFIARVAARDVVVLKSGRTLIRE